MDADQKTVHETQGIRLHPGFGNEADVMLNVYVAVAVAFAAGHAARHGYADGVLIVEF